MNNELEILCGKEQWLLAELQVKYSDVYLQGQPVPVAAPSKAWVFGRSPAEIVDSNPTGAWMFVVSVVYCQVEVSATDRSLVQGSPPDCDMSLCMIKKPRKRRS